MNDHLSWETLNDLVDGLLPVAAAAGAEEHARSCASCGAALAELRDTVRSAGEIPESLAPPPDLWTEVRATIEARKVARLPGGAGPSIRGWWVTPGRLAVAAAALVMVSAAATGAILIARQERLVRIGAPSAVAVSWQSTEREFVASVLELREQLAAVHSRVSPETVAKVEHALSTIDLAIAEARDALVRDPANAALSEILASNYRQKIGLLRRATQLASST